MREERDVEEDGMERRGSGRVRETESNSVSGSIPGAVRRGSNAYGDKTVVLPCRRRCRP